MPLIDLQAEDGTPIRGWVCGPRLKSCYACGRLSGWQCDYLVAPPSQRRCKRHICEQHRTNLAKDKDACPEHAPICLAAIERRKGVLPARA